MEFAHIVNPTLADPASDLYVAQPITFETMRRAQAVAASRIDVGLFSAQFAEDRPIIPSNFIKTPDLDRSVLDLAQFKVPRKLPLLADILDRLYETSHANYFIFTNVDIALQPIFYLAVNDIIQSGYDSFVINRRTISEKFSSVAELDVMYAEQGKPHRGWDCFVFPRNFCPRFKLYNICLGASRAGIALLANLVAFSKRFKEFRHKSLTFHIGDARYWQNKEFADYVAHNTAELGRVLAALEADCGPFERQSIPGSFLFRKRMAGSFYEFWSRYSFLPLRLSRLLNRLSGRQ